MYVLMSVMKNGSERTSRCVIDYQMEDSCVGRRATVGKYIGTANKNYLASASITLSTLEVRTQALTSRPDYCQIRT